MNTINNTLDIQSLLDSDKPFPAHVRLSIMTISANDECETHATICFTDETQQNVKLGHGMLVDALDQLASDMGYPDGHWVETNQDDHAVVDIPRSVSAFLRDDGNYNIIDDNLEACTEMDIDGIYPVGSELSTRYEHADGIVLSASDVKQLNIYIEK